MALGDVDLSLLGNRAPNFSLGTRLGNAARGFLGDRDLALALLANSSGPVKQSFGSILGQSVMQADQAKRQREDDAFKRQYMMAQMQRLQQANSPYGAIQPDKFTAESLGKFAETGKYSDLVLRNTGIMYGRYNPGDFTPESWAQFVKTGDPSALERYVTPQNATVENLRGGMNVVQADRSGKTPPRITPLTTPEQEFDAARQLAEAKGAGQATGEASGAQAGKTPALASMDYVAKEFSDQFKRTMQGRVAGPSGWLFDYGDKRRFDNLREQLSTELRTVFRIPGEGTLSDREQAQYGMQLPDTSNPPDVNEKILNDVITRARLRVQTPVSAPRPTSKPRETAAERAKMLGL